MYKYAGNLYVSKRHIAKVFGLSVKEVDSGCLENIEKLPFVYNGKQYLTLASLCDHLGFEYLKFAYYLNKYFDLDKSIEAYNSRYNRSRIEVWGRVFSRKYDVAKAYCISEIDWKRFAYIEKLGAEEAILKSLDRRIVWEGFEYRGVDAVAVALGTTKDLLLKELRNGNIMLDLLDGKELSVAEELKYVKDGYKKRFCKGTKQ